MTDLETALREQIRLAVNAQVALDVVTDHCHHILERFRSNLEEKVPEPFQEVIECSKMTPGQEAYAAHLATLKAVGLLDIDLQPTQPPFSRPGSEMPFLGVVVPTNTPIDLPSHGVQYEGDTSLNTGHTAVIRYE